MKGTYQVLKDSPARREDHISITGSIVYPLQFCPVRSGFFFWHDPLTTYRWATIIKHLSQYLELTHALKYYNCVIPAIELNDSWTNTLFE